MLAYLFKYLHKNFRFLAIIQKSHTKKFHSYNALVNNNAINIPSRMYFHVFFSIDAFR